MKFTWIKYKLLFKNKQNLLPATTESYNIILSSYLNVFFYFVYNDQFLEIKKSNLFNYRN